MYTFLDNLNFIIITIEPNINYNKIMKFFKLFSFNNIKNNVFYFFYQTAFMNRHVKHLFLHLKAANTKALSDQIKFNYVKIEKQVFISVGEINSFDDYSLPGNLNSRYGLDFTLYVLYQYIKYMMTYLRNKKEKKVFNFSLNKKKNKYFSKFKK